MWSSPVAKAILVGSKGTETDLDLARPYCEPLKWKVTSRSRPLQLRLRLTRLTDLRSVGVCAMLGTRACAC